MEKIFLVLSLLLPGTFCDLPEDFKVISYDLTLTVPSTINNTVDGSVTISLTCQKDTYTIALHWGSSLSPEQPNQKDLTITYKATDSESFITVNGFTTSKNAYNILTITTTEQTSFKGFAANGQVLVTATFKTKINADNKGLFYRQYLGDNDQMKTILMTNLRPAFARELFPCLDEPKQTAKLTLTLTYPISWSVAATASAESNTDNKNEGTTKSVFKAIDIPANTFALFLAENMTKKEWPVDDSTTKLYFWSRKGITDPEFNANAQYLGGYYYTLESVIGASFKLGVLNVVMVPGLEKPFAGYGLIFIREYDYAQDYSSPQTEGLFKANVAPVVELFIRQFTEFSTRPTKWSDYWVCRSVAEYLKFTILNMDMPFLDYKTEMEVVGRQTALYLDSQPYARPLEDTSVSTDSTASVETLVNDPLKSIKGAVILNMLDLSLPAGTVFAAIKKFLTDNQNGMITSDSFYTAIKAIKNNQNPPLSDNATAALDNLKNWFSNAGYPLEAVRVVRTGTPGTVNFTTTKFCSFVNTSCNSTFTDTYYVPATVGTKSENRYFIRRQDLWPSNKAEYSTNITIGDSDWTVANMNSGGYYRSSYEAENWERIISAFLSKDTLLVGHTQLLDDAYALALKLKDPLDYDIAIRLTRANLGKNLYKDWVPVCSGMRIIQGNFMNLTIYSAYKDFAAGLFLDLNSFLQNSSSDPFEKARIESLFLGDFCEHNIAGYRASAVGNLTDMLNGTLPNTISSSSYDAVVCCGARYNTSLKAQTLWETLVDSNRNYYNRRFASIALGCLSNYTDKSLLYNKTAASTNIQLKHYIDIAFQYVAESNPVEFLADFCPRVEQFQTQLGAASVASLLLRAGYRVNNNTYAAVLGTLNNNTNIDEVVRAVANTTLQVVSSKVTWLDKYNSSLVAVLQNYTLPSGSGSANTLTVSLLVFLPSFLFTLA